MGSWLGSSSRSEEEEEEGRVLSRLRGREGEDGGEMGERGGGE